MSFLHEIIPEYYNRKITFIKIMLKFLAASQELKQRHEENGQEAVIKRKQESQRVLHLTLRIDNFIMCVMARAGRDSEYKED